MEAINKRLDRIDDKLDRNDERNFDLLNKVEMKLDRLDERLDAIDKTMIKQEANLELHMKRSDNLEKLVAMQQQRVDPIEKHVVGIKYLIKVVIGAITLTGTVVAILEGLSLLQ